MPVPFPIPRHAKPILLFFTAFLVILLGTHFRLLTMPFFWDEAGQFVPQAHDLLEHGSLLPTSTLPNSHPPALPLLLAGLWKLTGESILAARLLMLVFAAAYYTLSFLLAIRLLEGSPGAPAFLSAALLLCHPLLYTQSLLVQLDLPSAVFTTLLLYAWLTGRENWAIFSALLAVGFKETSIVIPAVLSIFAWLNGRRRFALMLTGWPLLLLANWFGLLALRTGHIFGDGDYTRYNLLEPLHPARLAYALFRRVSYLGIENLLLLPAGALLVHRRHIGFQPVWRPLAFAVAAHTLAVTVTGGAVLERYLLPTLPVLFAAYAAALSLFPTRWRNGLLAVTCAGLLSGLFLNPPWPYPLENNLAMVDLVEIQKNAAGFVDGRLEGARITTAWPLTDAMRKPYLGYVEQPVPQLRAIPDFSPATIRAQDWRAGDILILYSRSWEPSYAISRWPWIRELLQRYLHQPNEITHSAIHDLAPLRPVLGYEQRGLWVEFLIVK